MAINFLLPLRGVQFLFAIIVLGTTGHIVSEFNGFLAVSQLNFLLFCAIWSFLLLIYLIAAPLFAPSLAHPWAILAIDALTMLFWFAGFIAVAVLLSDHGCTGTSYCSEPEAATVFGAFEWVLFAVTTGVSAMGLRGGSKPAGTLGA